MGKKNINPKYANVFFAYDPGPDDEVPLNPEEQPDLGWDDNNDTPALKLRTRLQHMIAAIAGNPDAKEINPKTRDEYFLSMIAGDTKAGTIFPKTKDESILNLFIEDANLKPNDLVPDAGITQVADG